MASMKCPQCGLINFAGSEKCRRCEAILSIASDLRPQPNVPAGGLEEPRFAQYEEEHILFEEAFKSNFGPKVALVSLDRMQGHLILTNRRIMFLSTGGGDGAAIALCMLGGAGAVAYGLIKNARNEGLTGDLDSALARPSSWALSLVSITKCEVGSTWHNGPFLRIEGLAQGRSQAYVLYGPDLTQGDLEDRKERLEKAILDTKKANESELSDLTAQ